MGGPPYILIYTKRETTPYLQLFWGKWVNKAMYQPRVRLYLGSYWLKFYKIFFSTPLTRKNTYFSESGRYTPERILSYLKCISIINYLVSWVGFMEKYTLLLMILKLPSLLTSLYHTSILLIVCYIWFHITWFHNCLVKFHFSYGNWLLSNSLNSSWHSAEFYTLVFIPE